MLTIKNRSLRLETLAIIGILFAGLFFRLFGVNYGLPYLYDPDEPTFVQISLQIIDNKDLNPHKFSHPASTLIYALSVLYISIYAIGRVGGIYHGPMDFVAAYRNDPTFLYLSGRLATVIFGVLSILLVYMITKRSQYKKFALFAALLIAFSPVHITYSKLIRMDVQMGLFLLVSLWFCIKIIETGKAVDYVAAGIFLGLAITTKYPAVVFAPTILVAHFFRFEDKSLKSSFTFTNLKYLFLSILACLGGIFISSPYLFMDFNKVITDVLYETRPEHLSATGHGFLNNLIWYIQEPLIDSLTILGVLFGLMGMIISFRSSSLKDRLNPIFPILLLLCVSALTLRWERWIVPALPFFCILIAVALDWFYELILKFRKNRLLSLSLVSIIMLIMIIPLTLTSFILGKSMIGTDTRTIARQWMLENLPAESRVLMELGTSQLPTTTYDYYYVQNDGKLIELDKNNYKAQTYRTIAGWSDQLGFINEINDIQDAHIQYIVMGEFYDRYLAENTRYPEILNRYQQLMSLGKLVYSIKPISGVNLGPQIRIYQLDYSPN